MDRQVFKFRNLLKTNSHYITKPRLRLFALLQKQNAMATEQLIRHLPSQDQATVYRNIKLFESLGIIKRLQLGWPSKLELSDAFQSHHHHMSCTNCGKVWVLREDPAMERYLAKLAKAKNFKTAEHQLEIRGLCQACQKLQTTSSNS